MYRNCVDLREAMLYRNCLDLRGAMLRSWASLRSAACRITADREWALVSGKLVVLFADLEIRRVLLDIRLAPTLLTSSSRSGLDFVNGPLASLVNGLAVEFPTAFRFRNLIRKASMS